MAKENTSPKIVIDDKEYFIDDLSTNCRELLAQIQVSSNAIQMFTALINVAKIGIEVQTKDFRKLLPDEQIEEISPEEIN